MPAARSCGNCCVKTFKVVLDVNVESRNYMNNPYIVAILAWIFPGAGHLVQKRIKRGVIISVTIWLMFIIGVISGGAYYPGFDYKDGALLYLLNLFAKSGNGLGLFISYVIASTPDTKVAALATFEYGGRFLEAAGLLNFVAILDAFDIGIGRKK